MPMRFSAPALLPFITGFLTIGLGHTVLSTFLQLTYYRRRALTPAQWKIQRNKVQSLEGVAKRQWWLPLVGYIGGSRKPGRHPRHHLFAIINILMASTIAGAVTHLIAAGRSKLFWGNDEWDVWAIAVGWAVSMTWQSIAEYYWHRLMHLPFFYVRLHKYHHYYKSPEPFDDLMIHPLEAFGYYLLLYSPPFFIPMPLASFAVYMIVCGICGVLDHSGIEFSLLGLYNSADHDRHHSRFEVNYAFPFPVMDVLHGTYDGTFLGWRFTRTTSNEAPERG